MAAKLEEQQVQSIERGILEMSFPFTVSDAHLAVGGVSRVTFTKIVKRLESEGKLGRYYPDEHPDEWVRTVGRPARMWEVIR